MSDEVEGSLLYWNAVIARKLGKCKGGDEVVQGGDGKASPRLPRLKRPFCSEASPVDKKGWSFQQGQVFRLRCDGVFDAYPSLNDPIGAVDGFVE